MELLQWISCQPESVPPAAALLWQTHVQHSRGSTPVADSRGSTPATVPQNNSKWNIVPCPFE
ncbi:hypothetical protein J2TS4_25240 [Paenibacillus sp. J2TS4]|nr:hypothetical protein J2TS4_25240 [Paenibacillus sp. J2TS4]